MNQKLLRALIEALGDPFRGRKPLTDTEVKVFERLVDDPSLEGQAVLGMELVGWVRDRLPVYSWLRKVAEFVPLGQGEELQLPRKNEQNYMGKSDQLIYTAAQDGRASPSRLAIASYHQPIYENDAGLWNLPLYKVQASPLVDRRDRGQALVESIHRAQLAGLQELVLEEDVALRMLVETACPDRIPIGPSATPAKLEMLCETLCARLGLAEKKDLAGGTITLNWNTLNNLIENPGSIEPVSDRERVLTGTLGCLPEFGVEILTTSTAWTEEVTPMNEVVVTGPPKLFARMGLRIEAHSIPAIERDHRYLSREPNHFVWDWAEHFHLVLHNRLAVLRGLIE